MPAVELMNRRIQIADNAFASIRILEVDPAILGSTHQYKYSLAYIVDGVCVIEVRQRARQRRSQAHWRTGIPGDIHYY